MKTKDEKTLKQQTLFDYKRLEVKYIEQADEEIISLLENTIQGSEGGIRYSIRNVRMQMNFYGKGLSFIALYKRNNLAGVIGLCRRTTLCSGTGVSSTFLRYLAVRSSFQVSGASARRSERISNVEESFKQKLFSMFSNPYYTLDDKANSSKPHVMYAYVESFNKRSINFIKQAGYEYLRSFLTLAFSRFNPSLNPDVSRLATGEEPAMAKLLAEQYRNYCFYTDEFTFLNNRYFVLRKNNEIVAGVCAIPTYYKIVEVPGILGWIMLNVLPGIPYLRRLFSHGEFRFLVLGSVYYRKECISLLPELFEAVCACENHNNALLWVDNHSELYEYLRTNRRMGTLNRILKSKHGLIYASFSNINAEEKIKYSENPAFFSGFDFA